LALETLAHLLSLLRRHVLAALFHLFHFFLALFGRHVLEALAHLFHLVG
jgi:hypothetical protein